MKFVATFILLGLLAWTWNGYKHADEIPVAIHFRLQNELQLFITQYIQQHVSGAEKVQFYRFWTEPTNAKGAAPNEVRAVFEYSFDSKDESGSLVTSHMTGAAFLTPTTPTSDSNSAQWNLDRVEIDNQIIDFKTGSVVESHL